MQTIWTKCEVHLCHVHTLRAKYFAQSSFDSSSHDSAALKLLSSHIMVSLCGLDRQISLVFINKPSLP